MFVIIFQLALVIGLGILALLLLQGHSLITALFRSGVVLVVVLFLLAIAGKVWQISMQRRAAAKGPENETAPAQPLEVQTAQPEIETTPSELPEDSDQQVSSSTQDDDQGSDTNNA